MKTTNPKILYIIPAEGFGGAERQAILHIIQLPNHDIEVIGVTGPGSKVYNLLLPCRKRSVHLCATLPYEYARPFRICSFIGYLCKILPAWLRSFRFLVRLNKIENVDLIIACRVTGWSLAAPLSIFFRTPCIWRFGSRVHGKCRRALLKIFGSVFRPAAVISNCNAVSRSVKNIINASHILIPNGVVPARLEPWNTSYNLHQRIGISPTTPLVGMAGRPSPEKGMNFLADVIIQFKRLDTTVHFCIAGEFGWRRYFEEKFKINGVHRQVSFLGHVNNMTSFYLDCDVIVLTSRDRSIEGSPNSLLEAMALNRPVVATSVGGVPELIEHNKTGILVKNGHPMLFARELKSLIENQDKRKRLGHAAGAVVRRRYSGDKTVLMLVKCINSVLSAHYGGAPPDCQGGNIMSSLLTR